ncbi:MAG: hypothetical protein N0E54_00600 [Candidatus Thiodiazotropha taylori]|nr:hypothetical protein [Candidatus Thiodiazotropha endolucinida]MCW4227216.1 hypothetical protein [Candidatus Thiodiazotropha taylori]
MKNNNESVGIAFGLKNTSAIHINHDRATTILNSTLEEHNSNLFNAEDYTSLNHCLNIALKSVTSWIGNRYVPVRVAIPDPLVITHAMKFDEFPKDRLGQHQLVSWQMEKTLHMSSESLSVTYYKEKSNNKHTRVFITAIDTYLLQTINSAFANVMIEPEAVMMSTLYCSLSKKLLTNELSAYIGFYKEYISIVVLNDKGMPYLSRSFWRKSPNICTDEELQDLIKDVKLTLHAFLNNSTDKHVDRLIIYADSKKEREFFQLYFKNKESISFVNDAFIEMNIDSSIERDYHSYRSALNAAYL